METIEPSHTASSDTEHEINFLLARDSTGDWPRWKRAAIGSAIFHLVAITALFTIKGDYSQPPPPERLYIPLVTHLYIPKDLTQKAPNKAPVAKIMMAPPAAPAPKISQPAPKAFLTPAPAPKPAPVIPPPQQAPVETTRTAPPPAPLPAATLPTPEEPKMIVADSLRAPATLAQPSQQPIQEAMRQGRSGGASPRNEVGDSGEIGLGAGLHAPASPQRPQSNLQLKSDPMGVDFKPYLLQVLQAVRTNWLAVYPEAARLGGRGQVVLEFAVTKAGVVAKVAYSQQTGAKALNEAAVAAISASNPLPPLPKDFKGDSIVLQMSFMYNMPR